MWPGAPGVGHQAQVNRTFGTSLWRNAVLMVDDGAIGSESLEQHRLDVAENLTKMAEKHHTIKPKKMILQGGAASALGALDLRT